MSNCIDQFQSDICRNVPFRHIISLQLFPLTRYACVCDCASQSIWRVYVLIIQNKSHIPSFETHMEIRLWRRRRQDVVHVNVKNCVRRVDSLFLSFIVYTEEFPRWFIVLFSSRSMFVQIKHISLSYSTLFWVSFHSTNKTWQFLCLKSDPREEKFYLPFISSLSS